MKSVIFFNKEQEYGISPLPSDPVEAMAYIPFQNAGEIYNAERGLCNGTMFPCLDKPFEGCCNGGEE